MLSVACVLKKSREYDVDYVEHLRDGVEFHLGTGSFVCLSDVDVPCERIPLKHDWPGWWCKMELFRPDIEGDLLFFDLDTVIVGDLSDVASVGCLTMLSDFYHPQHLASGMMFLPEKERGAIWDEWIRDPDGAMSANRSAGDGGFIRNLVPHAARWQEIRPGQVVSYKAHVLKTGLPKSANVVCFHGQPRPRAVNWKI